MLTVLSVFTSAVLFQSALVSLVIGGVCAALLCAALAVLATIARRARAEGADWRTRFYSSLGLAFVSWVLLVMVFFTSLVVVGIPCLLSAAFALEAAIRLKRGNLPALP